MRTSREVCPFLVPVVGDQLWVSPVSAYCRRPDARLRVPAASSILRLCTDDYAACDGYRAVAGSAEGADLDPDP
jgi:hypothetical protein